MKEKIKKQYMHYICIAITLGFLVCSVFLFKDAFIRIKESFVDLVNSIKYYFNEIFMIENTTETTINNYSSVPFKSFFGLPESWEEFQILWREYWHIFATTDNFKAYLSYLATLLYDISKILLLVVLPVVLILIIFFKLYMSKQNNNYNEDSKSLTIFKWLEFKVYLPIKNWCLKFIEFVKENNNYYKLWFFIWAYNFNLITIFVEFLAFYFYFVMSFDFQSIYIQFVKLFCDLSVMLSFIPPFIWFVIVCVAVYKISKKIGYARLNHFENRNCGFINERPIVSLICGTMGKKKTTTITDMTLSQEKMFRDKAFEKLFENDMKFPNFPWVNLENNIKYAMENHIIYNLATCRQYIQKLKSYFVISFELDKSSKKSLYRHLKKENEFVYQNFIFDYDYLNYGLTYDDKLKVVDIWEIIENYSQLYFLYIIQSSLILSNYAVRTDNILNDLGNFPLWDTDFFQRDSKSIDYVSRHSHIVDFDALRLGKKVIENNEKENSFDFGVIDITEIGKERQNSLELKEIKKGEETANQKNDLFNSWLKMVRHSATIDNFPFVKFVSDEQRPESWGADARDLCEIVHIKETSETRLAMPFFAFSELICNFIIDKFTSFYFKYRFNRSDNTLFMYLYKKIATIFYNFYKRIYNIFGYCVLDLQVENGTQDGILNDRKYYLMSKKIYSKRFSTDCFSDYFTEKTLKSKLGLNDMPEYETEKATFEELKQQNSYFINDLINKQGEKDNEK